MCYDAPSNSSRNAKHKDEVSRPMFYQRNIMQTRNGSVVVMTTDSSQNITEAILLSSTDKNFPEGSIVRYSSNMLHFLHCKDEKKKGMKDNCFLHGLDVHKVLESCSNDSYKIFKKNSDKKDIVVFAERKGETQDVVIRNRPGKRTKRITLKPFDLKHTA
jgi:hypothetical protein